MAWLPNTSADQVHNITESPGGRPENVDSQAPRPASESVGWGGAREPGILRLSLDWKPLIKAQHLLSLLGKLRPSRIGDVSGLVDQAVEKPGLALGPLLVPSLHSLFLPPTPPWPSTSG